MNEMQWLMNWCATNTKNTISIKMLENSNWSLEICIVGTIYEEIQFDEVRIDRNANDWIFFWKEEGYIKGACGANNLKEMLGIARNWLEENKTSELQWLMNWHEINHKNSICIDTLDNPGWRIEINIFGTIYEEIQFDEVRIDINANDWIFCWKEEGYLKGACGANNLEEMLGMIRRWIEKNAHTK